MSWPDGYQTLHEARQEELNGNASYGTKNSKAYEREFGKPYEGEMDGEIGAAELNLN